ncbi:GAF domain-containing protein [Kouleothrix sp.]|uniref:GAF domain-containing protein n=1 Tax=Kouleothrix sp. TaxID=2779161 RepID=UPI003918EBA6
MRSWLGVPLLGQGRIYGALMLESEQPNRYGDEELRAIAALGNQAAVAMGNARLYAEAQERTLQLEVVTRVTQEVSTRDVSRELPGILRTIIHQIRRVVPCDYAALALYSPDDDDFAFETVYDFAVRDWAELPPGKREPAEGTPWQTACRTGTALVQSELVRSSFAYDRGLAAGGLRSGVVMPIVGASRALGTLDFASREPNAYGSTQVASAARAFALPRHGAAQRAPFARARGNRRQARAHPRAPQPCRQGARGGPAGLGRGPTTSTTCWRASSATPSYCCSRPPATTRKRCSG